MPDQPTRFVTSTDGTPIAVFSTGTGKPLVLVHGAAADHTTFRVIGPRLAERFAVHAVDRRGRGASGDPAGYAIEREFADIAAVVAELAAESAGPVDVVGHSIGGRIALGAALRAPQLGRLVVYEGAPAPPDRPYQATGLRRRLRDLADEGRNEAVLETFLAEVVGMSPAEIAAYRANPVWPARIATARTIIREVEAEGSAAAGLDALGAVTQPVLLVLGGDSRPAFATATEALRRRLVNAQVAVIDGAKHAAHHTHPDELVAAIERFLARPAQGS